MVNCLAGCIKDYAVGNIFSQTSEDKNSQIMSPIIKADIIRAGVGITVGNESYPYRKNKACIKSIQFGFVDSTEGTIEIIDEEGGAFSYFMDGLQKCAGDSNATIKYQIGWVYSKCRYPFSSIPVKYAPIMESIVTNASSSLSNGIIRFVLNFNTQDKNIENSRENKIFGEQIGGKKMSLNQAIRELAAIEPRLDVKFARYDDDGKLTYLNEHKWTKYDPKDSWQTDNLNRYSIIQKWVEPFTVDNGSGEKGVIVIHSPEKPSEILILEDPSKEDNASQSKLSIGTFIVNGGNCSNVLEFSPSISFTIPNSSKAVGGSTNPSGSENELKKDQKKGTDTDNIGTQQTITISQQAQAIMGREASKNTNAAQDKHSKANRFVDINFFPISSAELRIVGSTNPNFYRIITGKTVSIVVINPFHIEKSDNDNCGDFLKKSSCHPVFSSRNWIVMGISHSVQDGSFVTTLKVSLNDPKLKTPITCGE